MGNDSGPPTREGDDAGEKAAQEEQKRQGIAGAEGEQAGCQPRRKASQDGEPKKQTRVPGKRGSGAGPEA